MDRDLESLDRAPGFTWRRLVLTVGLSAVILAAGSYLVRAYPTSGYDAGYQAVTALGVSVIRGDVDAAGGTSQALCDSLHARVEEQAGEPHYDYNTFVEGCRAAIEAVYGQPVPLRRAG